MDNLYRVAIHHENDNGFVEYDTAAMQIKVDLANEAKRLVVEKYLAQSHVIPVANMGLLDFRETTTIPSENVDSFKLALTRMWQMTGVHVDWSRPV